MLTPVYAPSPVSTRLSTYARGSIFIRNQVSVEELRFVVTIKNDLGWEPHDQKELAQRYLRYVLDILDEYRY